MMRNGQGRVSPTTVLLIGCLIFIVVQMVLGASSGVSIGDLIVQKLYILPGVLIGLCFHEFAHAFVAYKLGDNTPKVENRVTLNPLAHIDPIGIVALIFVGFGWGKPVSINPYNFKKMRRDEILVSVAGVTMNLLIAALFTVVLKLLIMCLGTSDSGMVYIIEVMTLQVIYINLVLMVFNLLPIPPLDGFNLITNIFNLKKYEWWYKIYNKGFIILLIFVFFNLTSVILTPVLNWLMQIVYAVL